MTTGTFTDLVAGRDLTIGDTSLFDTPATVDCPNGDPATHPKNTAAADWLDSAGVMLPPWGVNDWSLELWLYRAAADDGATVDLATWMVPGGPSDYRWRLVYNGVDVLFHIMTGPFTSVVYMAMTRPTADTWNHYVWTVNSSLGTGSAAGRRMKGYRNGASGGADVAFTSAFTYTTPTGGGIYVPAGMVASAAWTMAKVAIYHRELDATDANDHYLLMTT